MFILNGHVNGSFEETYCKCILNNKPIVLVGQFSDDVGASQPAWFILCEAVASRREISAINWSESTSTDVREHCWPLVISDG